MTVNPADIQGLPGEGESVGNAMMELLQDLAEGGGGGGITEITSTDMSVTITDPTGPTVDLSASGGSQPVVYTVTAADIANLSPPAITATLTTALVGANNDLTFSGTSPGAFFNSVSVVYADPGGNDQALTIDMNEGTFVLTVSLATGPAGAITSTASAILAAVNGDSTANQYVVVTLAPGSSGAGVVTAMAAEFLSGGTDYVSPTGIPIGFVATTGDIILDVHHYLTEEFDNQFDIVDNTIKIGADTVGPATAIPLDQDGDTIGTNLETNATLSPSLALMPNQTLLPARVVLGAAATFDASGQDQPTVGSVDFVFFVATPAT